jgi:uncharacterized membrane protein YoaK (UPF0700 family)
VTNIALEIQDVRYNTERAWARFGHVVVFVVGSAYTGALLPKHNFRLIRNYTPIMIAITLVLFAAAFHEKWGAKAEDFGYLCSLAAGMQNAMTTFYSGAVLRTTHVSGILTDIGIILGKILRGYTNDAWKLIPFTTLLTSFFLGGLAAGAWYPTWGRNSMYFSAAFFAFITVVYIVYMYMYQIKSFLNLFHFNEEFKDYDAKETIVNRH